MNRVLVVGTDEQDAWDVFDFISESNDPFYRDVSFVVATIDNAHEKVHNKQIDEICWSRESREQCSPLMAAFLEATLARCWHSVGDRS